MTRTSGGGKWTVAMAVVSLALLWSEVARWWRGSETHAFAVERGVSRSMQINLDIVVRMQCGDLHVNVQDAAGDRIHAASRLREDETSWAQWVGTHGVHRLGRDSDGRVVTGAGWETLAHGDEGFGEEHVHDIVAAGKKRARWAKTPRVHGPPDSCRIYGSLDLNKVQGDFHITARGHGYVEDLDHLDHSSAHPATRPSRAAPLLTEVQSSTFPTSSRSCRTAPFTPPSSTPSTAPSTRRRQTSTSSSTTSPSSPPSTASAPAPSSPTSTP